MCETLAMVRYGENSTGPSSPDFSAMLSWSYYRKPNALSGVAGSLLSQCLA